MSITAINNLPGEKKIILALVILLLSSAGFLFYSEKKQLGSANDSWEVYFENPKSEDLTFVLENHGKARKLHWKESSGNNGNVTKEADVALSAEQKSTIPLSGTDTPGKEKITIEVFDQAGEKKELYKLLD